MKPITRRDTFAGSATVLGGLLLAGRAAMAASQEQILVDRARVTVESMKKDPAFGNSPELLRRARGVMIFPSLFRAGFFIGGEGGNGVLVARGADGWSDPAFYTIGSASFGLQIGAQESQLVLFMMTEKALGAVLRNEFKIGADAGIAVATLGSQAGAATAGNLNADVISWASSAGVYGGVTINGSVIKPRPSFDKAYYGRSLTSREIVMRGAGHNRGANGLRDVLA